MWSKLLNLHIVMFILHINVLVLFHPYKVSNNFEISLDTLFTDYLSQIKCEKSGLRIFLQFLWLMLVSLNQEGVVTYHQGRCITY